MTDDAIRTIGPDREIDAEVQPRDETTRAGRHVDDVEITVREDGDATTVTLTRDELAQLNTEYGATRRPPKRPGVDPNQHVELLDHGRSVDVATPTARFRVTPGVCDHSDEWQVQERDAGHSLLLDREDTRSDAVLRLLERLDIVTDLTPEDDVRVRNARDIPRSNGVIPWWDAEDAPPETILEAYWRCPHCHETMPTLYDLWRAYRNRDRCLTRRNEYEIYSDEWEAYKEGVQHYRAEIERLQSGLDDATRRWVREVVDQYESGEQA